MSESENAARERVRDAIGQGRLPSRRPDKMWGGPGQGSACAVCGEVVSRAEMGFDLEFAADGQGSPVNHHMHVRCFAVWELERDHPQIKQLHRPVNGAHGKGCSESDSRATETGRFDVANLRALAIGGTIAEHERERFDAGKTE